jgi:hypothetical protein
VFLKLRVEEYAQEYSSVSFEDFGYFTVNAIH